MLIPELMLAALADAAPATCDAAVIDAAIGKAKAFMQAYANDLRKGDRSAIANRYHPGGTWFLGHGNKHFEEHAATAELYRTSWRPPAAFAWEDLSYEAACDGKVVVMGKFRWENNNAVLSYSYSALLVPVESQLKIRMEDESRK